MDTNFLFSPQQIQQQINSRVPNWICQDGKLRVDIPCVNFNEALGLANKIAHLAEKHNHHPELYISYTAIVITLYTHDHRGITQKDFVLAEEIDILLKT